MIEASVDSFACNYNKMVNIFLKVTELISKDEQKDFINSISSTNDILIKTLNSWK